MIPSRIFQNSFFLAVPASACVLDGYCGHTAGLQGFGKGRRLLEARHAEAAIAGASD